MLSLKLTVVPYAIVRLVVVAAQNFNWCTRGRDENNRLHVSEAKKTTMYEEVEEEEDEEATVES